MYREGKLERGQGIQVRYVSIILHDLYKSVVEFMVCCTVGKTPFSDAVKEGEVCS